MHKTFLEENIIESSVNVVFQIADDLLEAFPMTKSGDYDYTYTFPSRNNGDLIEFWIAYSDSQNINYVIPQSGKYKFNYGSDIISLNVNYQAPSSNYEISDFYPNPFMPANIKQLE